MSDKVLLWTTIILAVLIALVVIHHYHQSKKRDHKVKVDLNIKFPKSNENYHGMDYENYTGAF
jgi:hypothetical protein